MVKGDPRHKIIQRVLEPLREKQISAKQDLPLNELETAP